jgi:flagellar biosynthesis protein FlhF
MQVRVFEATDMASGLRLVKKELGPDALILSTRTVRNGKLGLIGKAMLEITAAIDPDYPNTINRPIRNKIARQRQPANAKSLATSGFRHVVDDPVEGFLPHQTTFRLAEDEGGEEDCPSQHAAVAGSNGFLAPDKDLRTERVETAQPQPDLQSEVNELKTLLMDLSGKIVRMVEKEESSKQPRHVSIGSSNLRNRFDTAAIHGDHILSILAERGVNVETSRAIAGSLRESLTDRELASTELVEAAIIETIEHLIQTDPPSFANNAQQRIALVGPTGVGKTTTLAKIAALYLSRHANSVALITIDTYRIAAVEQLKVYGEIMHLPVEVVITPEQLEKAIDRHRDKELILIDTAGRSPRDSYCIKELATFLTPELNIDKHLVLSATTREHELLDALHRFEKLGITHTIFTKIDECTNLGILLNVQIQNANPLSYFTNGQRVPEDLLEASPNRAAKLIMSQNEGSMHD